MAFMARLLWPEGPGLWWLARACARHRFGLVTRSEDEPGGSEPAYSRSGR
ncbi:hypothetical protein [Lysobacter gummosus]